MVAVHFEVHHLMDEDTEVQESGVNLSQITQLIEANAKTQPQEV